MPAYATATLIKAAIADMVKQDVALLPSFWAGITARAAADSEMEHRNRLLRRGFTAAQILDWPMLDTSSLRLGTWFAVQYGGIYSQFDQKAVEALDVREDLDRALVWDTARSEWVRPGEGSAGNAVSGGAAVTQDSGVFNFSDDPGDPEHGIWWRKCPGEKDLLRRDE